MRVRGLYNPESNIRILVTLDEVVLRSNVKGLPVTEEGRETQLQTQAQTRPEALAPQPCASRERVCCAASGRDDKAQQTRVGMNTYMQQSRGGL